MNPDMRDPMTTPWSTELPLAALIAHAVEKHGATALHFHTQGGAYTCTTRSLLHDAKEIGRALRAIGLRRGDVIAIQLPTQRETALLYLAALEIGAVLVPIVHIYGPAEVGFILRQSRARFLCVPDFWSGTDYLERVAALGNTPDLERVIVVGDRAPSNGITFDALQRLAATTHDQRPVDLPTSEDICLLLYTSGTTASPKGVQHSHRTVGAEWQIPFIDGPGPYMTPFPAGHIAGFNFLLRPFITGTEMVFMDRWDASLAARLVDEYRVRLSGGTPFHLQGLLEAARRDGRSLASLVSYGLGGTGVTPEHVAIADQAGFAGTRAYGLTEHSTVSVGWADSPFDIRACTDGRIQPGSQVRVVDELDSDLPTGRDGEILIKGPELFVGYTDPALNAAAFTHDGWFRTGDIGRVDESGCLTITDRKKDIVIRGGENISSLEVERVLATHPAVRDVAVVARPDARYGERVCAVVVLHEHTSLDLSAVQTHFAAAGVAKQKTPEHLCVVSELPRTASGKVKKGDLRKQLVAQ
ncbi:AMP-binding protein [Paraburkholderia youngii]|uniref:Cyclohexanecarboxylate-CoA ligase n=1 Tax=Paraburkholderia youngii TaxID=2782701 RepID=A0A7Y6N3W8_9BURK|nr:AMP-binding protein [Paraburkholderia youngii]NUY04924.1 cyclohexanecarboxylate-CoA ligase [Paraburkholderia youngii]